MKKTLTLSVIALLSMLIVNGQPITIDNSLTPQQLVEDTLISGCVDAFNITYTGDAAQTMIGYFNSSGSSFDTIMSSGIVLASGPVTNAIGPNNSGSISQGMNVPGDAQLDALIPQSTNDASVLEFDFIPSSDTLIFKYVFGSDEYLEYVNSSFNDIFAFFLSGPSPFGGSYSNENIAMIPGTTTPVSINNVNNVSYPVYYINNGTGATPNNEALQYDGYTVGMYAAAAVIPCETYHIKLAVADAGDSALDSGVFIESGSFTDGTSVTLNNVNPAGTLNDLYEGCESFYVFTRTDTTDLSFPVDIQLSFGGDATMGSDITTFPTTVTIPIGQVSDTIYYTAIMDGVQETTETFIINILAGCPCDPTPTGDTITIYDYVEFKASITNTDSMYCGIPAPNTLDLEAVCISHPAWFIDFLWSTGETTESITIIPPPPGHHDVYWVAISDLCGNTLIDSITVGVSELSGLLVNTTDALCYGVCNGVAQVTPLGTGNGVYYVWSDPALDTTLLGSVYSLCADNYTVSVTDDSYCYFEQNFTIGQPNAALDPSSGILPVDTTYCDDPGQLTITAFANIPDVTFSWNGASATTNTLDISPIAGENLYYVEIEDFCGLTVYDEVTIYVSNVQSSNINYDDISCYGECDGSVEILAGGIPPYIFQWGSNNSGSFTTTVNSLDSLCADTFNVNVIDAISCVYTDEFEILQPDSFNSELCGLFVADTMWCGVQPPAQISLEAYGNLNNINYQWSTGATSQAIFITPLQGTTLYTVTISDNCGNSKVEQVNIIVSNMAGVDITADSTTCYNNCDGTVLVVPQGGNTPFVFNWSANAGGSASSGDISNMCMGNYAVTVVDDGGCEFVSNFEITSPDSIQHCRITNTNTMYCGVSAPPTITLETHVNTAIAYSWSSGETTPSITFAPITGPNLYWVDFTDLCGNVHRDSILISVSDFSWVQVLAQSVNCYGDCNGQVQVNAFNGMSPYTYEWSLSSIGTTTVGTLSDLCAGNYSVSVYDQAMCEVIKDFEVIQPDSITFMLSSQGSEGFVNCNGFATATQVAGGNSPYSYLWSDPNNTTTYNVLSLCPGTYTVTVSDAKACFSVDTVVIENLFAINDIAYDQNIQVYPNPNNDGNFTISFGQLVPHIKLIEIFDVTGKLIYVETPDEFVNETMNIKNVPAGINLLQIKFTDGESIVRKLIVIE